VVVGDSSLALVPAGGTVPMVSVSSNGNKGKEGNQHWQHQHRAHSKYVCKCVHKKFLMSIVNVLNYVCSLY